MESDAECEVLKEKITNGKDVVDYPPNNYVYRKLDIMFVSCGMITFTVDLGLDIFTAITHYLHKDYIWFILTTLFICTTSITMTIFSLHWYVKDTKNPDVPQTSRCRWAIRIILNILQLGPILRYIDALFYGIKSRKYWKADDRVRQKQFYTYMLYEEGDSGMLRLFECFLEAAPQLVLQMYILTQGLNSDVYDKTWEILLGCGSITSLVSLAWGVTAYARGSRFTSSEKENISLLGTVVLFLWHLFSIAARVLAMVVFASMFRMWLVLGCAVHWLIMVIWLMVRRSLNAVCTNLFLEFIFCCILGWVYIFVFINEKDEKTRFKYSLWYLVCFVENIAMVVCWLVYGNAAVWYYIPAVVVHFVTFILGLVFMTMYYSLLHPNVANIHIFPDFRRQQNQNNELEMRNTEQPVAKL